MAQIDTGAIVRAMYKAFDEKDLDKAVSYATADAKVHNVTFDVTLPVRDYISNWATGFPDARVEIVKLIATPDCVVCEFIGHGTNTGPLNTPTGKQPPTGRHVDMKFCEIWDFKDGKITGGRMYFDSATMMRQLALMPAMAKQPAPQPEIRH